jgi:hypothetical protein
MSKALRFTPELNERSFAAWHALLAAARHRADVAAHGIRAPWLVAALVLGVASFAAGAFAGSRVAQPSSIQPAHQGACAALHMAATHGYLDERQQRVVMHALGTAINPQAELFPGGYRALRVACTEAAAR